MSRVHEPHWPVMQALLAQGAAKPTHARVAEVAFVNKRTISNVLGELKPKGFLRSGRPARLGPGMGLVLAISLGTETLRAGLVDCNGTVYCQREGRRDSGQLAAAPRALLPRIRSIATEVLEAGFDDRDLSIPGSDALHLLGASVAWPSPVDRSKRVRGKSLRDGTWRRRDPKTRRIPTLPEFLSAALGEPFSPLRCHALNDVSAAALGVAFRKCRERAMEPEGDQSQVGLVIRVGGGLGSGTIVMAPHRAGRLSFIDSQLVEGSNGLAGELGHLPIGRTFIEGLNDACEVDGLAPIDFDAWRCSCGRRHHLEAFASGTAVVRRLEASGYEIPADEDRSASLVREVIGDEPDERVVHALKDVGRILGRALTGPILMLDPYSITITGSLASEHLIEGMRRERDIWANAINDTVKIDHLAGDDGAYIGVLGAGLAVIRRAVYREFLDAHADAPQTFRFRPGDLAALRKRG